MATIEICQHDPNSSKHIFQKLKTYADHVLLYENKELLRDALEMIPIQDLVTRAERRQAEAGTIDIQDCKLLELLHWFKYDFFSWVDSPLCQECNRTTVAKEMTAPTPEEQMWDANRVELYYCTNCQVYTRFPRYNHPRKLLETRKGRCGEWANCFTLLCRALQFETRYVVDWTDHVWTEVFSQGQNRWLHCDPCENLCDTPLVYESGWKKELTYVIAFSANDVQDVTWRYSSDHRTILRRRTLCTESELLDQCQKLALQQQSKLPERRRQELLLRKVGELVEFLTPSGSVRPMMGRMSGSLAWRIARGETSIINEETRSFTFTLLDSEIKNKVLHVKYSVAQDAYFRVSSNGEQIQGWKLGVYSSENVFRKVEPDWKMAYLARKEDANSASVMWKFDFTDSGLHVDKIYVQCQSKTFENGIVTCRLSNEKHSIDLPRDVQDFVSCDFTHSQFLALCANLSGGRGPTAWQHAQLFRQSLDSNTYPLEVKITFK